MVLENNSLFKDPQAITDLVDRIISPKMYPIQFAAPFVQTDDGKIPVVRNSYNETTDPLKTLPPEGTPSDWEPDAIQVTMGELVTMNTQMRKVMLRFRKDDWREPNADYWVNEHYMQAGDNIARQLQRQCVVSLQATNNVTTTLFTAKKGDAWSETTADPLKALRALSGDFGNVGSDLKTVLVHETNWRELLDHLEVNDYDMTYAREQVAPNRSFEQSVLVMTLNVNPQINVVGIRNSFITEGRLIAVGAVDGTSAANTYYKMDPGYDIQRLPEFEDLPLQVNTYDSLDGKYNHVALWIDARTVVQKQNAVAYESGAVV
jgi:hypothetical protein